MTVGNTARYQFNMAQVQTKYGSGLDSFYGAQLAKKYGSYSTKAATKSLEDLLKSSSLKNKSDIFREQFSNLYKSIYGTADEGSEDSDSYSSLQSIKSASASAGGAAESIKSFANSLKYGGEVDIDAYKAQAQSFADSYNAMIDKVGNSDSPNILQKGVLMTNTGKVYSSALKRAGILVGADNKLTVNSDLSNVKATDIKTVFGTRGFSDKIIRKAGQINNLAGGSGTFSPGVYKPSSSGNTTTSDRTDNSGTIKELTNAVKEMATQLKTYAHNLGSEDKKFVPTDFTDTAGKFVEKYNNLVDEMGKSDKTGVQQKGSNLRSIARSYKYSLDRVGIEVGKDGKLSISDAITEKLNEKDVKYSFGNGGGFADKVIQKADQVKSLVSGAAAMGYAADKTATYAYNTGALYSVYA